MRGVLAMPFTEEQRRIRVRLLTTDGARVCEWCEVITQGGDIAMVAHVAKIHPERLQ